jgi:quercetin dioxygenase-like cupin family protein
MKKMRIDFIKGCILFVVAFSFGNINVFAQVSDTGKIVAEAKAITLNLDSDIYQEIADGPPGTIGMYSGLVTLQPGKTVGHHNTKSYEEMLVILSGAGQMIFENKDSLQLKYGIVAYCPPNTEHDVKNTGTVPLKYIYIASKTTK